MPRIFDNIEQRLRPALAETMGVAHRADFCVGYFNLRGWRSIDAHADGWAGGPGHCCRILVSMQRLPHEELRAARALSPDRPELDNQTALRLKRWDIFLQFLDFEPRIVDGAGNLRLPSELKMLYFDSEVHAKVALCLFNSSLFYWYMKVFSDRRNVNRREIESFPIDMDRSEGGREPRGGCGRIDG